MKKIIYTFLLLIVISTFYTCSKDDTITNSNNITGGTPGSFSGDWTVDKVQMVQAPSGTTTSSIMKQALVPFGEVDAGFAGYLDLTFGAEVMSTNNINTNIDYSSYLYFTGNTGYWLTFYNNAIKVSSDGGITWNSLMIPFSPVTGFVYSQSTIYLISNSSVLIKSTNSGTTWNTINSQLQFSLTYSEWNSSLCFVNEIIGYAITNDDKLYKTTNGGINWNNIFTWNSSSNNRNMKFFDELNGVILDNYTCKKTTNGGNNWNEYPINTSGYIYSWYFLNSNTGWATGYSSSEDLFFKTNNGGQTWTRISDFYLHPKFLFVNENEGYAIDGEFLLKTTNSGINWQNKFSLPPSFTALQLHIINGEPAAFTSNQIMKPTGVIDTTKWTATGRITNSAIKLITHAPNSDGYANGESSTNSDNIIFSTSNYTGGQDIAVGVGAYSFDSGFLNIILNLPNEEKWKIKLKRK